MPDYRKPLLSGAMGSLLFVLALSASAWSAPFFPARPTTSQAFSPFDHLDDMPAIFENVAPSTIPTPRSASLRVTVRGKARAHVPPAPRKMRALRVMATAYALRGRTAGGTRPAVGTIAVDPRVIPLGTRLYVPGYGWGQALDTGGAIRGNIIDLWMPSVGQCSQWGVRTVEILVEARAPVRRPLLASRSGKRKPRTR